MHIFVNFCLSGEYFIILLLKNLWKVFLKFHWPDKKITKVFLLCNLGLLLSLHSDSVMARFSAQQHLCDPKVLIYFWKNSVKTTWVYLPKSLFIFFLKKSVQHLSVKDWKMGYSVLQYISLVRNLQHICIGVRFRCWYIKSFQ